MYNKKSNLIIGFHGCDQKTRDAVVNGEVLKPSLNSYDWLGNGIYFWESDPIRAYEWAEQAGKRTSESSYNPSVLGAVIDLGHCLDLTNRKSIKLLSLAYEWLKESHEFRLTELPKNRNIGANADLLLRDLDCAVIQMLHSKIAEHSEIEIQPFDSVRGVFTEGGSIYEGSGFMKKTHCQLCITNPNCIKGYFIPRELDDTYSAP